MYEITVNGVSRKVPDKAMQLVPWILKSATMQKALTLRLTREQEYYGEKTRELAELLQPLFGDDTTEAIATLIKMEVEQRYPEAIKKLKKGKAWDE